MIHLIFIYCKVVHLLIKMKNLKILIILIYTQLLTLLARQRVIKETLERYLYKKEKYQQRIFYQFKQTTDPLNVNKKVSKRS